jgi:uncharacterized protein (TIGR01244 family)
MQSMTEFRAITSQFSASPQIALSDVDFAHAQGFKAIVCNRPDGEDSGQLTAQQIATACESIGLSFVHIPVSGGINQGQVEQMATAINAADGPVLAYCRSGTRSTNLWAMARALDGDDCDGLVSAAAAGGYDLSGLLPSLRALGGR